MFGKFHKYNSRNREFIQSTGVDDLLVVKNNNKELTLAERANLLKSRQDPRTLVLNGLIGWWRLDEGQGNVGNDASGIGNHAPIPSGVTWTDGYLGKTFLSTNTAGSINLSSFVSNFSQISQASFSVCCWFRFTNTTNAQPLLIIRQATSTNQYLHILKRESTNPFANKITFAFWANDDHSITAINDNKWHHFTGTYDYNSGVGTGTRRIYIDGVLETTSTSVSPLNFSPVAMYIGYVDFGTATAIDGSINDMRIYNRALNASEVDIIYNLGSGDVSKLISSNINTTGRNTSSLINKSVSLVNNFGLVDAFGKEISAQQPTRADNLVGWWPLNEGTGLNTFDRGGKNYTATANGAISWTNDSYIGTAISLTGTRFLQTSNVISTTDLKISNAFTVCCWAKSGTTTWNAFGMLFTNRVPFQTNLTFNIHPDQGNTSIFFYSSSGGTAYGVQSARIPDITAWNHYTGTYDGTNLRLWINGTVEPVITSMPSVATINAPVYIGVDSGNTARLFNGSITDCRIYNTALNQQEIMSIMQERRPLESPRNINDNLIIWWPMNEGNGTVLQDYSGNRRTITLNGTNGLPTWQYTGPNNTRCLRLNSSRGQTANTVTTYSLTTNLGLTNKLTVSAWIKSASTTWNITGAGVTHRNISAGAEYGFLLSPFSGTSTLGFYAFTTTGNVAIATINDVTQWHHYLGVYNGATVKLYVDGILGASSILTGTLTSGSYAIRVGGDYAASTFRYLNGEVSDVRIYNTDLSDTEILNLYQETVNNYLPDYYTSTSSEPSQTQGQAAATQLLQLTGQSFATPTYVVDYSGYQHHANIAVASAITYSAVSTLPGQARSLLFNGTTGYLVCDGSTNNGQPFKGITGQASRTFSTWINPTSLAATRPILSYGVAQNRGLFDIFLDTAGNINVNLDNSNAGYIYKWDTRFTTGAWQYLSLTQDSDGTITCYKGTSTVQPTASNLVAITNMLDSSNLQVWLPFKEGQGTIAYDISGNTTLTNATLVNSTFTVSGSKFRSGTISLNGTSGYLTTSYLPNLSSAYSWSIWINPNRTGVEMPILAVGDNDGFWEANEFVAEISSSNIFVIGQNGQFALGTNGPLIQSNIWTHLGLAYNGAGTYSLYVNGVLSQTRANTSVALGVTGNTLTIGRYGSGTSPTSTFAYFSGNIADFRAYNSNLSANAMSAIYYNNWDRINTGLGTNNLQIGKGMNDSPYANNYYSGYMDDIRMYSGVLTQDDIINIWSGGNGSYSQVSSNTYGLTNMGLALPFIPTSRAEISLISGGLQAPAFLLASGFGTAFTNKTITYTPISSSLYSYSTTSTISWPPESFSGHTKVFFGAGAIDDAKFDLLGSNTIANASVNANHFVYYGQNYGYLSVCTNGHFSIGVPDDTQYTESYPAHYGLRRISMFFNDLMVTSTESPNGVYYGFKSENATNDVCVITYWGIADLNQTGIRSNCQVKLYLNNSPFSGRIVMSYGTVQTTNALSGISNGATPTDTSQGTNIAIIVNSTSNITYGSWTSVLPDNIYSSNTIMYNYAPGNRTNAYFNGIDSNAASYHIRNGLVGWWKLDEPSGSIYYDVSGSGLNGTLAGTSLFVPRLIGPYNTTCINLEGNTYVSLVNGNTFPVVGNNLTISAWFNCSNISGNNTILGLNTTSGTDRLPILFTRQSNLIVLNGSTVITETSNIPLNSWNHVVVSATSGDPTANIRVYLNSQLFATSTTSNTFAATDKLFIGADLKSSTFSDYFTGQIADVRLYNRRLTDNEVKLLYNWSPGLSTQTRTGTYSLDLFGSQISTSLYSRRLEQTGTQNSNSISIATWAEPLQLGTHTIAASKSTGDRLNGDWVLQIVSPGYDALKGWWLLNEGTGTICYDLSPFGFNGTTSGLITWQDALKTIKAMVFNGSTSYVTLDTGSGAGLCNAIAGNKASVSFWINPTTVLAQQCIVSINTNGGLNSLVIYSSVSGVLIINYANTDFNTGITLLANSWQFITVTIIGQTCNVYYNSGSPIASTSLAGILTLNSNDRAYIGVQLNIATLTNYFNGMITDVRIWNRVLSKPEINDIFQQNQYLYAYVKIGSLTWPIYDTTPITLESWRHIGFQYNATIPTISLYIDGIQTQSSSLITALSGQPVNLTSNIVIGALSNGGTLSQYMQGRISDFRQYNTIIPDSEYFKLSSGYYEQVFKLGITAPNPGDTALITGLIDKGTKYSGIGGKSGISQIIPVGEPQIQQISNYSSQDGYELVFDGVNDYLDLSNCYIQRAYNRSYSITGWIKPDTISTIVNATTATGINSYFGYAIMTNMLYTFGGFDGTNYLSAIRRFDGLAWYTDNTILSIARREIDCAYFNGNIYMVGGFNGTTLYNTVQRYDGRTLTTLNNFPLSVRAGVSIVYNNKLYHIGGSISTGRTGNIYVYDNIADSWSLVSTLNTARAIMQAVVYNGVVYIIGGTDNSNHLSSVEIFNGTTCTFTYSLTQIRSYHVSAVINGYIYNFGGVVNNVRSSNTIERFDGRSWTVLPQTLITGRDLFGGGIINGKYYLTSGYRAAGTIVSGLTEYIKPSGAIFTKASNDYSCYALSYDYLSNTYIFDMGIGNEKVYISMAAPSNIYNHVSVISSGINGFIGMYLNGVLESSTYLSGQYFKGLPNITNSIIPYICKRSDDEASYFQGTLTDIRLWEKALTASEILQAVNDYKVPGSIIVTRDLSNRILTTGKVADISNGLLFWLSGEQLLSGVTKIVDKSGAGIRATVSSVLSRPGRLASTRSMYFNSTASITIPPSTFYNLKQSQLSVAFWVKFTNANVGTMNEYIFLLAGANIANDYFDITRSASVTAYPGELRATFYDNGDATTALKITDTNWHHFVVTYDGNITTGTRRTYLDGALLAVGTNKTSLTFSFLPIVCQIGTSGSEFLDGYLEDFRIYNRALTFDEIKMLYNTVENPYYITGIQNTNPGPNQISYLSKYALNNKGQVIDIPLPAIARDNLICHYDFSNLAKQSGYGLDSSGYVPDSNWKVKPLANYRTSSYLSNSQVFIPYNYGVLGENILITNMGLVMDGLSTSNLAINPSITFNDAADWTMCFYTNASNLTANITLWSYTALSSANNKSLFINASNSGEIVFRVGTSTDYNTGMYLIEMKTAHIAVTKGTVANQINMVSFYKDGCLTSRQQISLTNDGVNSMIIGPFAGYIQDYRIYSTQLNQKQIQNLALYTSANKLCGPKHMWRFDESNTSAAVIIRDLGTEGTNLVLSNITIENRATDTDQNRSNAGVSIGCIYFNGSNAFAQAFSPGVLRDNPRTFTFWMKPASNSNPVSDQYLIDYGRFSVANQSFTILRNTSSKLGVSMKGTTSGSGLIDVISTKTISNTMWNHVGVVVLPPDNNKMSTFGTMRNVLIYLNGENVTDTTTWSSATIETNKTTLTVGEWLTFGKSSSNNPNTNYFVGFMDDIRIYDVALTPQEIRGIYLNSSNYAKISLA